MRAIWITKYGGPEVLEVRQTPDPEPKAGQVKVRVAACGLNFAELTARKGLYPDAPKPPCVVGYEGAGTIEAVGAGVDAARVGQRVLYLSVFGGHADVVVTDERRVFEIPSAMSFEQAAALPVNYLTAYHMLFQLARVRSGESVLVHMAAGGVGTAVLQLCRTVPGLTTFGTASASKHEYIRSHGCDHPIDYHSRDYAQEVTRLTQGRGVSLVLDALGGPDWRKGYELLRPAGMLIAFGLANVSRGPRRNLLHAGVQVLRSPRFSPMKLMDDNRTVCGCNMGHMLGEVDMLSGHMHALLELFAKGRIAPQVSATFPFERAGEAYGELESRRNRGKVLLIPKAR